MGFVIAVAIKFEGVCVCVGARTASPHSPMMRRAVFNQLELERLDWVSRHDYYDRLYAKHPLRTIRELANHMSPDVLLSGANTGKVIMYRGGPIPLPNKAGHAGGPKKEAQADQDH